MSPEMKLFDATALLRSDYHAAAAAVKIDPALTTTALANSLFSDLMPPTDLIGYLAATLTTAAFIPQALLTWRTRRAEGVSLWMYSIFVTGVALWLVYGCLSNAWPVIVANALTLLLALFILIMKLVYK